MKQNLSQIQTQSQQQVQTQVLSPQQVLQVKILELPINELEERVNQEIFDNPALESGESTKDDRIDEAPFDGSPEDENSFTGENDNATFEQEERRDMLNDVMMSIGADDAMPDYRNNDHSPDAAFGESDDSQNLLQEQISELNLTDKQKEIMEYLVGSLDDDGYLRKDIAIIATELALNYYLDVDETEVREVLTMLQGIDPAGIAAKDLQECLLLQIDRMADDERPAHRKLAELMRTTIAEHFDEFKLKHWEKIQKKLGITNEQAEVLFDKLRHLNPKPGAALNETTDKDMQQVTPDFVVETQDDGTISFYVNRGNLPSLKVTDAYDDILNNKSESKSMREARKYASEKISSANCFIEAIRLRYQTMYATMKVIIEKQRKFFEEGDETMLKPMILKDIAERIGADISTVSRATRDKYVQTCWGIFPLRMFFNDSFTTASGEETSTIAVKQILKELIDAEDKKRPLSDEKLTAEMQKRGYPIARRTIAKYREQLNIPVARLRK